MVKPSIRLLAVDIDGTLTDSHFKISSRNIAALRAAHEAGVQIMLATGRRHDYAMPVAKEAASAEPFAEPTVSPSFGRWS